tara:strand:+ start:1142 stop:2266 length:1125 start_codon:yes stop_codon:yes gene_type:complete
MNILIIGNPTTVHDFKWITAIKKISNYNLFFLPAEPNPDERIEKLMIENGVVVLNPLPSIGVRNLIKVISGLFRVRGIIKKHKIDLVHSLFVVPYAFWGVVTNKPKIITSRGSDILIMLPELLKSKHPIHHLFGKIILKELKFANHVTCTSKTLMAAVKTISNNKNTHLIRTGVDVKEIANSNSSEELPNILKGKKIIFSPRWIEPIYGHEFQIETIRCLPINILEEYVFVFVRYKTLKSEYVDEILGKLNAINGLNFICFNNLSLTEMYSIYNFSDLIIMSPDSDGTPNSALEAMSAKCPLIMSDLAYDEDLFLDTSIKIKVKTPEYFAGLIKEALNNYDSNILEKAFEAVSNGADRMNEMSKVVELYKKSIK